MEPENKPMAQLLKEWAFNFWCFICLYTLGAYYTLIEFNRKYNLFGKVRRLDPEADLPHSLSGYVCVITGGSRGIGWETTKTLLIKGCHVIVASSVSPGKPLVDLKDRLHKDISLERRNFKGKLEVWHLNLMSMNSIVEFAKRFEESGLPLNVLINNAGQMYAPYKLTEDKFESHWAVNYLGHSLLAALLLPVLERTGANASTKSRIINVSSSTHFSRNLDFKDLNGDNIYSPFHAYAQSKLAQIMFTYRLHEVLTKTGKYDHVSTLTLHPGVAKTELYEHVWWVVAFPFIADQLFRTAKEGAETVLYAGFSSELEGVGGKYLEDCAITKSSSFSTNADHQERLWQNTAASLAQWLPESNLFTFDID